MPRITIADLPTTDALTPEEQAALLGAGSRKAHLGRDLELDQRALMAAGITSSLSAGVLKIYGTTGNDTITVRQAAGRLTVDGTTINRSTVGVTKIEVWGGDGHDRINLANGVTIAGYVSGQVGNDTIYGGSGNDTIFGYTGNDLLYGNGGNDILSGWDGSDTLYGSYGNDSLYGHGGNDYLSGNDGADYLNAGTGLDSVYGGAGTDTFRRSMNIASGLFLSNVPLDSEEELADEPVQVSGAFLTDNSTTLDSEDHIYQKASPTCIILASLSAVAEKTNSTNDLVKRITYNASTDTYGVKLFINGAWRTYQVNGDWNESYDPAGRLWVTLYQKAYLQANSVVHKYSDGSFRPSSQWYSSTGARWNYSDVAIRALTGKATSWVANGNMRATTLRTLAHSSTAATIAVSLSSPGSTKVIGGHGYMVYDVSSDGAWVTLRNPWGVDGYRNSAGNQNGSLDGYNNGYIKITWSEFTRSFSGYQTTTTA